MKLLILCSVLSVELTDIYRYTYHCTIQVIGHYDLAGTRLTDLVYNMLRHVEHYFCCSHNYR